MGKGLDSERRRRGLLVAEGPYVLDSLCERNLWVWQLPWEPPADSAFMMEKRLELKDELNDTETDRYRNAARMHKVINPDGAGYEPEETPAWLTISYSWKKESWAYYLEDSYDSQNPQAAFSKYITRVQADSVLRSWNLKPMPPLPAP